MKALNLVGQKFERLTVIRNATKEEKPKDKNGNPKPRTWCICQCDCGNITIVAANSLVSGNTKSCGCLSREKTSQRSTEDLTNQKFGKLTVIKRDEPSLIKGERTWECQCECGNIIHVSTHHLKNNNTKSCGCLSFQKHIKDIAGQKFGKITVLSLEGKHDDGFYYWNCECECGNKLIVRGNNLKTGNTTSCGCEKSRGEYLVAKFLKENNYNFKREYSFPNLTGLNQGLLRFDFCLIDKDNNISLIEVNGTQHFKKNNIWYTEEGIERDKIKQEYCKNNNIPLLILNYNIDETIPFEEWKEKIISFGGKYYRS